MNYLFYDDETTGSKQIIIQIGFILTDENGHELDRFQSLVNPMGEPIEPYVTHNIHHITDAMVADAPNFLDVWNEHVAPALEGAVFVAHGAWSADMHHIAKTFRKHGTVMPEFPVLDTLSLARALPGFTKFGIAVLADHYGITCDNHHDALADSEVMKEVYFAMRADMNSRQLSLFDENGEPNTALTTRPTSTSNKANTASQSLPEGLTICVTGHRPNKLWGYDLSAPEYTQVRHAFTEIVRDLNAVNIVSGMALGFDQLVADEVTKNLLGNLIATVPFVGQESRWPVDAQRAYADLLAHAHTTVIVSPGKYAPKKMQVRNEWMVDHADIVIALWDGTDGGTANCIRYAKSQGKTIYCLDPTTVIATADCHFERMT